MNFEVTFFHIDRLSVVMLLLIGFMGVLVGRFSFRYLAGSSSRVRFYTNLMLLVGSVAMMVCADHLVLFWLAWCAANACLQQLMRHNKGWRQARASSQLAGRYFRFGGGGLAIAFTVLCLAGGGEFSIQAILGQANSLSFLPFVLMLLTMCAFIQSAIWPFHTWLLSSMNAPTPVSALMHAGLVNGGGFLLARFASLYAQEPIFLQMLFVSGLATALLGTLWKLMQSDVKRMLACSTMSQMGCMIMQCGLGLFPMAVAHLCWHGLFKAYLFLGSGSVAANQPCSRTGVTFRGLLFVMLSGLVSVLVFATAMGVPWLVSDSRLMLFLVVFSLSVQSSLTVIVGRKVRLPEMAVAGGIAALLSGFYGLGIRFFDVTLLPVQILFPQPLGWVYLSGMGVMFAAWLIFMLYRFGFFKGSSRLFSKWYVQHLNASQPHASTVTTHRNDYVVS